jgi:hypothetical protein
MEADYDGDDGPHPPPERKARSKDPRWLLQLSGGNAVVPGGSLATS